MVHPYYLVTTKAAIGIRSINGAPNKTNPKSAIAATIPESLPRPPELTLMID